MGSKAARNSKAARQLMNDSGLREAKSKSDTVRVWENYREQALLWRAMALLELPTTLVAVIFSFILWYRADITIHVPQKPLPGYYAANEIPEDEFVSYATDFINLISTYQPRIARRQFEKGAEFLVEPFLSKYVEEMLGRELTAIESTGRTQLYYVDPTKTKFFRIENGKEVLVVIMGDRLKLIAGENLPEIPTMYKVRMKTIPRNPLNKYGIVITNIISISHPDEIKAEERKQKKYISQMKKAAKKKARQAR